MTQYDAGPGDWSAREWEAPDYESEPHATRRRLVLPPWALMAIVVAAVILLCVGLFLLVRAIREGGAAEEPTPTPTVRVLPTATIALVPPTATLLPPTPTVVLPTEEATEPPPAEVGPGATVVVTGTGNQGLNLRREPTTDAGRRGVAREGTSLVVVDGPQEADGYTWWLVRTDDGVEGWAVADYLALQGE